MSRGVGLSISSPALIKPGTQTFIFTPNVQGYVQGQNTAIIADARNIGASAASAVPPEAGASHSYSDLSGDSYSYRAGFASFDTSSLSGKTIISAVFQVTPVSLSGGPFTIQIKEYNFGATITTADFHVPGETTIANRVFSGVGTQSFTNVAALVEASINKTGTSYYMFCHSGQTTGQAAEPANSAANVGMGSMQLIVVAQ